jgi:hypothetical protein
MANRSISRNALLAIIGVALIAPFTTIATVAAEHRAFTHRQAHYSQDANQLNNSPELSNPNDGSDQNSLNPDDGSRFQDRQGHALDNSRTPPRVVFRDEGSDVKPFIAIIFAVTIASGLAYFIGFRAARKRHSHK